MAHSQARKAMRIMAGKCPNEKRQLHQICVALQHVSDTTTFMHGMVQLHYMNT